MSALGRRIRPGVYEVTFWWNADDCEGLASCMPSGDAFGPELLDLADEMRRLENPDYEDDDTPEVTP